MLNLAGELFNSKANGPGLRYVLFTQGCSHNPHCRGCQNSHTWDNKPAKLISVDDEFKVIQDNMPLITGVTFSGGEPFDQAVELASLAIKCKSVGLNVMCYSGYTLKELREKAASKTPGVGVLLRNLDILVDGGFEINNQKGHGIFRGSKNQIMYHLDNGKIIYKE